MMATYTPNPDARGTFGTLLQMSGAVVDLVYRINSLPAPGTEVLATSGDIVAGGGFNAMFAATRAGLDVTYGGGHGTGPFADIVRDAMAENAIPLLQPPNLNLDQGSCVALIDRDGERSFVSKDGAEGVLDQKSLTAIDAQWFDWVLLSGYTLCYPESRDILRDWVNALEADCCFVFDPSPVVEHIPEKILAEVLAKTSWVSCNNREARTLTGEVAPSAAAKSLLRNQCPQADGVVIRLGADGCLVLARGREPVSVAGFKVAPVIDTNGAGDTHIGAFLAALSRKKTPKDAALYANAAAALSTLRSGPATAPDHDETIAFLTGNVLDR